MWRTFDVGAVVESLAVSGAVVVGGSDGLKRTVRRARIASTTEQLRRVGAHDLVVMTAATLLSTDRQWTDLIGRLDAARVAAIAVRLDHAEPLPAALISAADQLAFPLITFPRTTALADVTTAVLDALLVAQGHRLERFLDIHQRFTNILYSGGGTAEIAAALHTLVECPIAVMDSSGHPIALVPSDLDVHTSRSTIIRHPILAGDHRYGEILAYADDASFDDDGLLALERASSAIAVRLAHASAVAAEQQRFAATTLEELIAGRAGDLADVAERAISFGWDLSRPRAVLLASIDPPTDRSVVPPALSAIAAAARATLGRDAIVWTRSTAIAALVAPKSDEPAERRSIADALRHELDARVRTVTVSIGVGRRVADPTDLRRSYVEASRAVEVGRWAKGRHATEVFDELGLERLLASAPTDDLVDFVRQAIGPLVDHDRAHHADLVETLAVWLATRNMAEAARVVHVHYNTFKNRLERIESILGPVVNDARRALECEVAIYVIHHYDGPWAEDRRV